MNRQEWNSRLVNAVFFDLTEVAPEIRRINATDGFLAEAGGFTEGVAARESFLATMPHTESGIRGLFAASVMDDWSPTDSTLPFYAQLHLTILAASAEEELQDVGNFRRRLAQMLTGSTEKDFVSTGCLPRLWEQARAWTRHRFERYQDTRLLVLPDPGHEKIIGYSKGLAFPGFRDQTRLAEILTEEGLDALSPVSRFRTVLASHHRTFTYRFQEELTEFERRLDHGDLDGARDSMLWETIVETTWERTRNRSGVQIDGCRIEIDPIDPYDIGIWCYGRKFLDDGLRWSKEPMERLDDGRIAWRLDEDHFPGALLDWLRSKWTEGQFRSFIGSRLGHALAEGCVGFVQDEHGHWLDTPTLPDCGVLWLILHRRNVALLQMPAGIGGGTIYRVPLDGSSSWTLFGPIDVTETTRDWFAGYTIDLEFFAPRLVRRRLFVVDSIQRPDGAYLYLPPVIPAFRCSCARTGYITIDEARYELTASDDRLQPPESAWIDLRPHLEAVVVAQDAARKELACGRFRFCDSSAVLEFKAIRSPEKWLESSLIGRLRTFSLDPSSTDQIDIEASPTSKLLRPLLVTKATSQVPIHVDLDRIDERWWRTTEILSSIFGRRYAWPVGECSELLERIWGSRREGWARLGDLVENGVLRLLNARHWSGRVVVAGLPVVVLHPKSDSIEVRIVGLLSAAMRAIVSTMLGGQVRVLAAPDRSTVGALIHHVDGLERIDALHAETTWPLLRRETSTELKTPAFEAVFASSARSDFDGYDDREKMVWSMRQRLFLPVSEATHDFPRLERWRTRGLQDLYVLHRRNGLRWNSDCRTWAVLALAADRHSALGESLSDGTVHLSDPSLSLPRPLPWLTVAIGGGVCFRQENGTRTYPAGDHWSPSDACERWIERKPLSSKSFHQNLSARDRYALLIQRKRMRQRSM